MTKLSMFKPDENQPSYSSRRSGLLSFRKLGTYIWQRVSQSHSGNAGTWTPILRLTVACPTFERRTHNDLAESWTPISRATIWCNVRYTTRPKKTWAGPLISEASQVLTYIFKIESFKSLPRIPCVFLRPKFLTGLRYCCINRLTLTCCFRRITRKEVCNPLSRFLNFL